MRAVGWLMGWFGGGGLIFAIQRAFDGKPWLDAREAERNILRVATAHRGRITATEVAAESPVPVAQASKVLEALTSQGACRMSVAESGILVFEFPGLGVGEEPVVESERQAVDRRVNIEH